MNLQKVQKNSYYSYDVNRLAEKFGSDLTKGLTNSQVNSKLEKCGYNELPEVKRDLWKIYLAPIFNFFILILLFAGIIIVILGSASETIITFTVVFVNSITAIIQQYRAQKALESLRKISSLTSTVIRKGEQKEISSREIVPGDIVLLSQGSKVPADGRICDMVDLSLNEAALTGESKPVVKTKGSIDKKDLPVQKRENMVFMGTYVLTGRAKILITTTGIETEIGKISKSLNEMGSIEEIPLTKKLNRLAYILAIIVLINVIVLIIYKLGILNLPIGTALTDSIIRAMNIMPINLPLLVTLVLITGVLNMARSGVIIKNLSAIESLGRVSVICADKTGTITKNEMTIEKFWINNMEFEVTGSGYESEGEIVNDKQILKNTTDSTFIKFIHAIVLNNNAKLVYEDVKVKLPDLKAKAVRKALGSPTEASLLVLAEKAGFILYDLEQKYEILMEFPFDSSLKRMTKICKNTMENKIYAFTKGAPETILNRSSKKESLGNHTQLDDKEKERIKQLIQTRATQGYRTLAVAYKELNKIENPKRDDIEKNLIFLGFVSIIDPPREGVKESINQCKSAGIRVIMITGDHPSTAKTIASAMSIYKENDLVVKGSEMKKLSKENFNDVSVFARVEPSDKEIIVKHYQDQKKIVAMTGDGVNDSLALKLANCGIAMGITGTDVAKDTSDMVISDDNFTSIKRGVEIGRGLFSKIRTIIYFFICLNIMEGLIFFGYEFIPTFELFSSNWQQIYIFAVAHSFPSLALLADKIPKDVMQEPPRDDEEILNKNVWFLLVIQAIFIGIGVIIILELTLNGVIPLNEWNLDPKISYVNLSDSVSQLQAQKARTMFITTVYIAETSFIWTFRRPNKSLFRSIKEEFSLTIFIICTLTLLLHILVVLFSSSVNSVINDLLGLNFELNFMFLSITDWFLCILFGFTGIIGAELVKYYFRIKNIGF